MRRTGGGACAFVVAVGLVLGCMPPPVRTVDQWLDAYTAGDREAMVQATFGADRDLLREALAALDGAPTSSLALSLPPRPLDHTIVEIAEKSEGRRIVATELTLENPLPSASKRIGQSLPGVPETRTLRRRFLVVEEGSGWGVKLDLARVMDRSELAAEVLTLIAEGRLVEAEDRLTSDFPPPPDDGTFQPRDDRLVEELRRRIDATRARTATTAESGRPLP